MFSEGNMAVVHRIEAAAEQGNAALCRLGPGRHYSHSL